MFRFEDPQYLYLLTAIPLLALIRFLGLHNRMKKLRKLGDLDLVKQLMPEVSRWRGALKFWLLQTALALAIVMLARPQIGASISHETRVGIETIIAMDISNSMRAEDVSPSRLDRAKMMVENLVDHFKDDKIGLIVFAGEAFVQLPITSDFVSAKMFLQSITPDMMSVQGTDIARAIEMATHSFTPQKGVGKAIVVITDGEDHEGEAIEAARQARKQGYHVYVLGIGSRAGAPIPIPGSNGHMTDRSGEVVMSRLNEQMCRDVAAAGGGAYIHVENGSNAQQQLDAQLGKLAKAETESTIYSEYDEQFQAFGLLVILLLVVEAFLIERKSRLLSRVSLFARRGSKASAVAMLMALLAVAPVKAQNDRQLVRQGNKQFRMQQFDKSETTYRKALDANDQNPQAWYNLGNSLMGQQKDSAAVKAFEKAVQEEKNPRRKAMSYHNMGVVCQNHKMYGEAIEAYKQSLRLNPSDNESRYNLELCKKLKKEQDKNQQNQNQQQKDEKGDNKKQEQQKEQKPQEKKQDEKKPEQQKPQMSKDNAEQLLNAAMQNEKQTQRKLKEAQQKAGNRQLEKNW